MDFMKTKKIPEFYRSLIIVGLPLMIQQFVSSSLNFIDNLMIGRLGTDYIAAVGFANNTYRIYDLCLFGIYSGMGIFIAQYYGKKNYEVIRKIFGKMIQFGFVIGIIFSVAAFCRAEQIIRIYTDDPNVLRIGISYLKKAVFCYNFYAFAFAIGFTLRSMGLTKIPMIASAIGVTFNTFFNYLLIYGNFGFPRWEEKGAAIATIIARCVEMSILIFIVYIRDYNLKGKIKEYLKLPKIILKEIIKKSVPVFFTETLWILGTISLTVAYARLGTKAAAATQISEIVMAIGAIVFMGVANAASVMIGHTIGQGDRDKAISYSKKIVKISMILAIICALAIEAVTPIIVGLYKLEPDVSALAIQIMRIIGISILFKMVNWSILIGLFRAGGDTKIAFLCDTLPLWLIAVPAAFIGAHFKLPLYQVVIMAESSEIVKLVISFVRYKSMRWIKDVTV